MKHVYERVAAYGVPGVFIEDGNDLPAVRETMDKVIKDVRAGKGPCPRRSYLLPLVRSLDL